jgi:hypothetical protein
MTNSTIFTVILFFLNIQQLLSIIGHNIYFLFNPFQPAFYNVQRQILYKHKWNEFFQKGPEHKENEFDHVRVSLCCERRMLGINY